MPELPEVETVRRGLAPKLEGAVVSRLLQRRRDLRLPLPARFAARIEGRRIVALRRRAKYLLAELDDGTVWLMHLGMSGRMMVYSHNEAAGMPFDAHDHVVFETESGWQVRFRDPRRFGLMLLLKPGEAETHKLLKGLGPEPLEAAFTGAVLAAALKGRRTPIKAALLDQRVVAGIGNIYACEGLFLAGLAPTRLAGAVQGARAERLVAGLKQVLNRAIEDGGSTLRDHVQPNGELGYFQTRFSVYDREGQACAGCGRPDAVRRMVQSGRSTFHCPRCQR